MFLNAARLEVSPDNLESYLARLSVVRALATTPLEFRSPITVITGENGVGKSTLIEALAVGMGLNPEGGSRHTLFGGSGSVSSLQEWITLSRSRNPKDAFFLRGESFYNVAGHYAGLVTPPGVPRMDDLLEMSHGQSLMALIERRFHTDGLFFLDEPEAGLSVLRQLELMGKLFHLAAEGSQIIMATHSPALMAIPGAGILEIGAAGISRRDFEDAEAVRAAREFVADPEGTAAYLIGDGVVDLGEDA
ncbi:AAA family ATPase [Corynebacterium sp. A21]|uniref:AAA family ATPase n=1 Tax=Corynebacterium sp. A21 TaxID=3457318 RepID=UPI003FD48C06